MQNMDYYQISAEELGKNSKIPILKLSDSGEVFYELALEMKETIEKNNQAGRHTVFICPVGPIGQYPIFVRLVNRDRVSLKNCWFINMDEYLNDDETYISEDSPLTFRGFMKRSVYEKIDPELVMPQEQRIFPDPKAPEKIHEIITRLGGVDVCFGGIGINGHLAFNEAQDELSAEEFAKLPTRVLTISRETRTSNAIGDRSVLRSASVKFWQPEKSGSASSATGTARLSGRPLTEKSAGISRQRFCSGTRTR